MRVHELGVVILHPSDRSSGYLREADLNRDSLAAIGWSPATPVEERRVVIDLRYVVAYGAGTTEKIARQLVDCGAGQVQVEGTRRAGMRNRFTAQLREAIAAYEREVRR